jgi:hypothetical protein
MPCTHDHRGEPFPPLPKSKEGARRQYDKLVLSYAKDFAGGGMFGFDWPTFRLNCPDRYMRAQLLGRLFKLLPSRAKQEGRA